MTEFIRNNHIMQFVLALVIIIMYFITYQTNHASAFLEYLAGVSIAFFFVNSSNTTTTDNANKIEALSKKVSTQEALQIKNNSTT